MVNTESRTYPIYFESDFSGIQNCIREIGKVYSSYVIITDSNVAPLYADDLKSQLESFGKNVVTCVFEAGEQSKNIATVSDFYGRMIDEHVDRKSLVLALGGGVAGDMSGFAAATYMRGIDFVQVPTSLLSQVDSSVGGKTGIDFKAYKNVVGAFYQPMFVYINVNTLKTLPARELYSGMSEVIKHGLIKDADYFRFLQENVEGILSLDEDLLKKMIEWSCRIKKSVVDEDEKETGARALLNFGHTFGHGIERLKDFELVHGECVAIGMHGALKLSNNLGLISEEEMEDALALIRAFHLPTTVTGLDVDTIYSELFHDKKTTGKRLVFALLNTIGDSFLNQDTIDEEIIRCCIEEFKGE